MSGLKGKTLLAEGGKGLRDDVWTWVGELLVENFIFREAWREGWMGTFPD